MKLVIGGYAQGKLACILEEEKGKKYRILQGEKLGNTDMADETDKADKTGEENETDKTGETVILNHLHLWVRNRLRAGGDPEKEIRNFLERVPDCVIICDEVGNGIVPMEAFERAYRERTGRILVMLAKEAEEVVRVICGIGQRIK